MGNFNKFDKGRSGGGFGGGRFGGGNKFGGRDGGAPRQMYPAMCSQCGKSCEVPFKPTGERPVYCKDCFQTQGGPSTRFAPKSFGGGNQGSNFGSHSGSNAGTSGGVSKAQIDALNVKLDKILSLLSPAQQKEKPNLVVEEIKIQKEIPKKAKAPAKKSKAKKK